MTSALPTGWVSTRPGAVMASADVLRVTVTGKGGHASEPYRAVDPVPVACEIVTALNSMITRSIDPFDPAVLTVARLVAGTTNNVIPETAMIEGTIRAVSERTRSKVHDGVKRVAEGVAAAHGCGAEAVIEYGYPVTTNNDRFADFSLGMAREVAGPKATVELPHPVMGAEDFSYVLNEVPGCDGLPRWDAARVRSLESGAEPFEPRLLRGVRDGDRHRPLHLDGAAQTRRLVRSSDDAAAVEVRGEAEAERDELERAQRDRHDAVADFLTALRRLHQVATPGSTDPGPRAGARSGCGRRRPRGAGRSGRRCRRRRA